MKGNSRKNLLKVILISTVGICLFSALVWAATPDEVLRRAQDNKRSQIIEQAKDILGIRNFNFRKSFNLSPAQINFGQIGQKFNIPRLTKFQSFNTPKINVNLDALRTIRVRSFNIRSFVPKSLVMPKATLNTFNLERRINAPISRLNSLAPMRAAALNLERRPTPMRATAINAPRINTSPIKIAPRINAPRINIPRGNVSRVNLAPLNIAPRMNSRPSTLRQPARVATVSQRSTAIPVRTPVVVKAPTVAAPRATLAPAKINVAPKINVKPISQQSGQLQSIKSKFNLSTIGSARGLKLLASAHFPSRFPRSNSVPMSPLSQREPVSLPVGPVVPNSSPSQASGNNGASGSSNNHASSAKGSGGSGIPLTAPLILGLCGHLPASSRKKTISRIISEVSRRLKNGIGFMLAPRSPTIIQMGECALAFVHQIKREKHPAFIAVTAIQPISVRRLFVFRTDSQIKDRCLRSQAHCGLFYPAKSLLADGIFHLVREDGR